MFIQKTKSRRGSKTYVTHLVRESFRTKEGPRSRTIANISKLPAEIRDLIDAALSGRTLVSKDDIELKDAKDYGGIAVLLDAWKQLGVDRLISHIGTPRDRALIQAMIFSRLLFPCAKMALKNHAAGTLLAAACGLDDTESFDEEELYEAMDALTGNWCALEKLMATEAFKERLSFVLYDLTSIYFEGSGPTPLSKYGHSRDHRNDRLQIILAVATDSNGVPLHLSILRGNRADATTLESFLKILNRRFGIKEAVFAFDGGMSSKLNLEALKKSQLKFVTRLSNATLEALLKSLPKEKKLERADENKLLEIEHEGKRYVIAGGPWRQKRDQERRASRLAKAEAALTKLASAKRLKPDAQKIASQVGRTLQTLKAHKYFSYHIDSKGILHWEHKKDIITTEMARDGWYLLHTNLSQQEASESQIQGHYKNLLEVEEAFCELKSYLRVRPVFHYRPDRVINHVRLCFLAYWISARLANLWRSRGQSGEVTRHLRELQKIRVGTIQLGKTPSSIFAQFTNIPSDLNHFLEKLQLLHLFATPPKWALTAQV